MCKLCVPGTSSLPWRVPRRGKPGPSAAGGRANRRAAPRVRVPVSWLQPAGLAGYGHAVVAREVGRSGIVLVHYLAGGSLYFLFLIHDVSAITRVYTTYYKYLYSYLQGHWIGSTS